MNRTCAHGAAAALAAACASHAFGGAVIVNGGFETGDFTGWIATDLSLPFDPLAVRLTGTITFFQGFLGPNVVIPSEGNFAANNGFDGEGPGVISIAQDIGVPTAGQILAFDFRMGWDLISFVPPGALDRPFDVVIEPAGGGAPLGTFNQLVAMVGTDTAGGPNSDTGPLTGMIDLTPFAGIPIRVNFAWTIPQPFTGPGNAQLDNVRIVPTPGAAALAGLCGLASLRRRR